MTFLAIKLGEQSIVLKNGRSQTKLSYKISIVQA